MKTNEQTKFLSIVELIWRVHVDVIYLIRSLNFSLTWDEDETGISTDGRKLCRSSGVALLKGQRNNGEFVACYLGPTFPALFFSSVLISSPLHPLLSIRITRATRFVSGWPSRRSYYLTAGLRWAGFLLSTQSLRSLQSTPWIERWWNWRWWGWEMRRKGRVESLLLNKEKWIETCKLLALAYFQLGR